MGAPIPLPNIQLKVFKPDVSKYHANRIARIRAIGERARQDKQRKEAYSRAMYKEFMDVNVEKYKFTTEYFQEKQVGLINEFQNWSARQQANEGKAFSESELLAAKKYARGIDQEIEAMTQSEMAYKEDGKLIAGNLERIDVDFRRVHEAYDPREHGLYSSYLKSNGTKASMRKMGGTEISANIDKEYGGIDNLDKRTQLYVDKTGNEITDVSEFEKKAYTYNDDDSIKGVNHLWQYSQLSDYINSNSEWEIGIGSEFDELSDENKKYYTNVSNGIKSTAPSGSNIGYGNDLSVFADGNSRNPIDMYYYDRYGDRHYQLNKEVKIRDASMVNKKEPKVSSRGGMQTINGKIDLGQSTFTSVEFGEPGDGYKSSSYVQLADASFKNQRSVLNGVRSASPTGQVFGNTISADDFNYYDTLGIDYDFNPKEPYIHVQLHMKDEKTYGKDKSPVYEYGDSRGHYEGTASEIKKAIKEEEAKRGGKKTTIKKFSEKLGLSKDKSSSVVDFRLKEFDSAISNEDTAPFKLLSRVEDVMVPASKNPGIADNFIFNKPKGMKTTNKSDGGFSETQEASINAFMEKNNIKDKDEAVAILKKNKRL